MSLLPASPPAPRRRRRFLKFAAVFAILGPGLVAASDDTVIDVAGPPEPVMVAPDSSLDDVIEQFVDSRGSSVLVVDDEHRPVGRILGDDLVDALLPDRGRVRFPRLFG